MATTTTIAISGKGGVGKSTFAALSVRYLAEELGRAVLAVDADPNATLGLMLGVTVEGTVADLREDTLDKKDALPAGMTKTQYIEYRIQQAIGEHKGFDLLTMGRPEGPGCYCYVNSLLRTFLERLTDDYPYVVIDNEAGMEHLSRRTNHSVDLLLVLAEPTAIGVDTAGRIAELAGRLPIPIRRAALVLNRVQPQGVHDAVRQRLDALGLDLVGQLQLDDDILTRAAAGESLLELPRENQTYAAARQILARALGTDAAAGPR
jgi:CO dehydrogenase maturation factor